MSDDFKRRGYHQAAINEARKRATDTPRPQTLTYRKKQHSDRIPFVVTYHPANPPLQSWLRELQPTLHNSKRMQHAVPEVPVLGERCRGSLRSLLMPSVLPLAPEKEPGCKPCTRKRCMTCQKHLVSTRTFKSDTTGEEFDIRNTITCDTPRVIYVLFCNACKQSQYVGQTSGPLRQRFYLHRSDINRERGSLVTKHFNSPGHSLQDMRVIGIERVYGHDLEDRLRREGYWMKKLRTITPEGLNTLEERS